MPPSPISKHQLEDSVKDQAPNPFSVSTSLIDELQTLIMSYPFMDWEIWKCGHVTSIEDGAMASESGELSHIPRFDLHRSNVKNRLGERCPRCYTTLVKERLGDIRGLMFNTNVNHEAMAVTESRLRALKLFCEGNVGLNFATDDAEFKEYPPAFKNLMRRVLELEKEVCAVAVADLAAAMRRRRTRLIPNFLERIKAIQSEALAYGEEGNETVREYVADLVGETSAAIEDLEEENLIELELLKEVDEKADELRGILEARWEKTAEWMERMSNPKF
ncbi:hypothetical protein F5B17DRAFT_432188 [Nemania serpens]|nr:hypothetical protein F5B17DRAFT_432188 [Nemania serpens]